MGDNLGHSSPTSGVEDANWNASRVRLGVAAQPAFGASGTQVPPLRWCPEVDWAVGSEHRRACTARRSQWRWPSSCRSTPKRYNRPAMARLTRLAFVGLVVGPVLPAVGLPGFAVSSFIAPMIATENAEEAPANGLPKGGDDVPHPPVSHRTDAPALACLGSRPGRFQSLFSLCGIDGSVRSPVWPARGASRRCLPDAYAALPPAERELRRACCDANTMAIDAPPIQPNAPPARTASGRQA